MQDGMQLEELKLVSQLEPDPADLWWVTATSSEHSEGRTRS